MVEIDVIVECPNWNGHARVEDEVAVAVRAALAGAEGQAASLAARAGEVAVLLADDATLQRLNADFRGMDKPTNVLSFPAIGHDGTGIAAPSLANPVALGDIALAYETCVREAEDEGKTIMNHMRHLVVHGVLHLLGYDHENEADADVMERREIAILAGLGIADPYAGAEGGARE